MSEFETLQARNKQFAEDFQYGDLQIKPAFSTMILSCVDARINPGHFLNLVPGEVVTFRNTGGRVTDDIERELTALLFLGQQVGASNMQFAIIHHTDCGVERFANPQLKTALTTKAGLTVEDIEKRVIHNHEESLHEDINRLKLSSLVPDELVVSGHLYHTDTGSLEQVIAPIKLSDC